MMRAARIGAALVLAFTATIAAAVEWPHVPPAQAGAAALTLEPLGNFENPVYVAVAPGYSRLVFVVEQPGRIQVLRRGQQVGHPFLDLSERVSCCGERGLLSVAFPRDYERSGRFYVYYTNSDGDIEVDELQRSSSSATVARASSRRQVIVIPHPDFANHNGGQLQFGPDGYLYMGTGDGGGGGDTNDNARHLNELLGKLLRIDPRRRDGAPYTVPRGNPYVGRAGRNEIFSYGLRNPWRFSFNSANGDIAIGDVGQNAVEEIDYVTPAQAKGANFGWPQYEGDDVYDASRPGPDPPTFPIFTYMHSTGGCAVIGGYVVHSPSLSSIEGRYVYSDLCTGDIRTLVPSVEGGSDDVSTGLQISSPTAFGQGYRGRIYVTSDDGPVYRLVDH